VGISKKYIVVNFIIVESGCGASGKGVGAESIVGKAGNHG